MHCEIHLTKEDLIAKDACSKGIELFDEMFPDGMHGIWDQTAQLLLIASPLRQYFGWACYWGLLPRYDLRYADLSSANLRSADLSSANLRSADLSYADLRSANLCYANLRYADLSSANLSYADLSSANLSSADLSSANLSYADLSYANLCSADLSYARNIELADLTGAYRIIDDAVIQGWTVVNGRLQRATVEAVKS